MGQITSVHRNIDDVGTLTAWPCTYSALMSQTWSLKVLLGGITQLVLRLYLSFYCYCVLFVVYVYFTSAILVLFGLTLTVFQSSCKLLW